MHSRNCFSPGSRLSLPAVTVLTTVALVLLIGPSEALADKCKTVHGRFIDQVLVLSPPCTSPVNTCVSGKAKGGLKGDFFATVTSITPSIDTLLTAVVFETADTVLHTKDGDLQTKEATAYNADPNGHGDLGNVTTIMGGTGKWLGATGRLRIWGNLTVTESDVNYEGTVCLP
ncbi:MAG: hypothetical protein HY268_16600 [Deltaproteobacteria bacterium]|nr:hypothetical protein [Deltaproteobacteria bacterium]